VTAPTTPKVTDITHVQQWDFSASDYQLIRE